MIRLYIPVYATTLILSAFLLFSVQPLFGKMILPTLGGSSSVWNTSMLFFQAVLLMGYAYAHGTTKLFSVRTQSIIHIVLLIVCCVFLPLGLSEGWPEPDNNKSLIGWQLGLMAVSIGAPFFVLSGSAPMFQRWFSKTEHKDADNPYFLYGASNLGSMTALLTYPFLVEPIFTLSQQSMIWSSGYLVLIALTVICAAFVFKNAYNNKAVKGNKTEDTKVIPITYKDRLSWLFLAFIPSSLMLGVTTHITTDIASIPLFWIIPLALYVGTFIIAFARNPVFSIKQLHDLHLLAPIIYVLSVMTPFGKVLVLNLAAHIYFFAITAQLCHSILAKRSPHASHLTEFYLLLSLGGVLGGIFNALLAPLLFPIAYEYTFVLAASLLVRFYGDHDQSLKQFLKNLLTKKATFIPIILSFLSISLLILFAYKQNDLSKNLEGILWIFIGVILIINIAVLSKSRYGLFLIVSYFLIVSSVLWFLSYDDIRYVERNYFGTNIVSLETENNTMYYFHGTTVHGMQLRDPELRRTPVSYYYKSGTDVFDVVAQTPGEKKIAVTGLGAGVLASFSQPDWHFDYYEIDPVVKKIAEDPSLFTFLSDSPGTYDIILGDARLKMQSAEDHSYDLIFLDAFSSDSIPVHLMTQEAFDIYFKKLKETGFIAMNLSNRYLNLEPIVNSFAEKNDVHVRFYYHNSGKIDGYDYEYSASFFAVLAKNEETLAYFDSDQSNPWRKSTKRVDKVWTDNFANLIKSIGKIQP